MFEYCDVLVSVVLDGKFWELWFILVFNEECVDDYLSMVFE